MGRLAQATRRSMVGLRTAAQAVKSLRGNVDEQDLRSGAALLLKVSRKLPRPDDIGELLDDVRAQWDAQAGAGKAAEAADLVAKRALVRTAVAQHRQLHKLAVVLVHAAQDNAQAFTLVAQPARDIVRAPVPTVRFSAEQMAEWLTLAQVFVRLVERYARRMRSL